MTAGRILLVEDDRALVELIGFHLDRAGYETRQTASGEEALDLARDPVPDLVLLDWMIEGLPGIDVCRRLRQMPATKAVPIIMMTARGEESDRIRGLDTGADDYITKPFSPKEMLARVAAVLRRARPAPTNGLLTFADLELDVATYRVRRGGVPVHLSPSEFRLLRHFMENPRRVHSRRGLLDRAWTEGAELDPRTVDVQIRRMRKALNAGGRPDLIRTIRSAGYAMDSNSEG